MNLDFALFLVLVVFFTALICLIDLCFFASRRQTVATQHEQSLAVPWLVRVSRSLFPVFLLVLLLRSFLFEPFRIPSASMMPTLLIGDFILVNKYVYGLRLPVLDTLIREGALPQRGDVVVFRYPLDTQISYIKRVAGVPGDHIVYQGHTLYVNGQPVPQQRWQHAYQGEGASAAMNGAEQRSEFLADLQHDILVRPGVVSRRFETTIPEGYYFVLGDNRDNSRDSRFWGLVPEANLVGRAFLIWMHWDWEKWHKGFVGFSRIGDAII